MFPSQSIEAFHIVISVWVVAVFLFKFRSRGTCTPLLHPRTALDDSGQTVRPIRVAVIAARPFLRLRYQHRPVLAEIASRRDNEAFWVPDGVSAIKARQYLLYELTRSAIREDL